VNYVVELEGGERWEVSVDRDQPSQVRIEGATRNIQIETREDGTLMARIDGRLQALRLKYEDGCLVVETPDGRRRKVRVEKASTAAWRKHVEAHVPDRKELEAADLRAPIAGNISELLVADGDRVDRGQPVLRLEAMKMLNTIASPCAGVIRFETKPGATVPAGALLARVDSKEVAS